MSNPTPPANDVHAHIAALRRREDELLAEVQALRRAHAETLAQHHMAYDFAPVSHISLSCDGSIVQANRAAAQLMGIAPEHLVGAKIQTFVRPEDHALLAQFAECVHASGEAQTCEIILVPANRAQVAIQFTARFDAVSQECRAVLVDITARLVTESELIAQRQELLSQTETLSRILENIPIAVFIKDVRNDFRITMWNRAAERIFQIPKADILGKNGFDLWPHEQAEFYSTADRLVVANKVLVDVPEEPSQTKDRGTIILHTIKLPLTRTPDGEVDYLLCICEDITERKRFEAEHRHNHKMEAVGRLSGHISHDFNNLLAVVDGYSSLLLSRMAPTDPLRHMAEGIQAAALRGGALVKQLLLFGRKHVVQKRHMSLNATITEVTQQIMPLIAGHITVTLHADPGLAHVLADPDQIHQLVMNLVVNAKDAMPNGGTLTLTTANLIVSEQERAGFGGVSVGSYVQLTVRDTGMGMSDDVQRHLFEPFFTTKAKTHGSGLGLSIVHGIVEDAGGHISVWSRQGEGSQFSVLLPQGIRVASTEHQTGKPQPEERKQTTVLVVDDDRQIRDMFMELLEASGFCVISAEHGADALERCRVNPKRIQVVLSDIDMPDMNGVELAQEIMRLYPHMCIALMSGHPRERVMGNLLDGKGVAFLAKPIRGNTLVRTLHDLIKKHPRDSAHSP
ncbi:MAG: PAS domain-containing protein [Planctomycetota bacterium]